MMMFLSDRLQEAMRDNACDALVLSKACGVSRSAVYKWLDGGKMNGESLARASAFLQVNPTWLAEGKGKMRPEPLTPANSTTHHLPGKDGQTVRLRTRDSVEEQAVLYASFLDRLPPRERALLENYRASDESGKRAVEGAASACAQPTITPNKLDK